MLRSFALVAALLLAGLLAVAASRTPAPVPADAPAQAFSAERAFADVEAIAARPHPIGTAANAQVRDHLAGRMRALGLQVRVQPDEAAEQFNLGGGELRVTGGKVENLIGVLPGRSPTLPALAVMAHYDSAPGSPGAADDAAGVASALEIARALKASGGTDRDVVFLITDGEEAGLLGARAFFAHDPLASRIGAVINMEARGGGGRVFMFETGRNDGATIARFARARVNPSANSLTSFIYSIMPNNTDLTVAKQRGLPGMNFAFIGEQFDYHSASSTPAQLDKGSLQHMGEQVLAAARELAGAKPLPAAAPDVVYSDVLGHGLIVYPAWGGWVVLLASAGLAAFAFVRTRRAHALSVVGTLRGLAAALALTLAVVPLAELVRQLSGGLDIIGERAVLARFPIYELALLAAALAVVLAVACGLARGRGRIVLAAVPIAAGVASSLFGGPDLPALICGALASALAFVAFARPVEAWSGWAGAWILVFLAALGLQLAAPVTAFALAWPLLVASLTAALAAASKGARLDSLAGVAAALVGGVLVTAQLLYFGHFLALGVGESLPGVIAPFVLAAALALYPLTRLYAEGRAAWTSAALATGAAVVLALIVRLHPYASPRTPELSQTLYVVDFDHQGRRLRADPLPTLDPWSRAVLEAGGGRIGKQPLPPAWKAPIFLAPSADAPSPAIPAVTAKLSGQAPGRVELELAPPPEVDMLRLDLKSDTAVADVILDGQPLQILAKPGQWSHIAWAAPKGRLALGFRPRGHGRLEAHWTAVAYRWPSAARPLPPRPAEIMPWGTSDSTVTLGSLAPDAGRF